MAQPCLPIANIDWKMQNNVPLNKGEMKNIYGNCNSLQEGMRQMIRIRDRQDYCNRIQWYFTKLPLKSNEINRMFYHRSSLAYFYCEPLERFMLCPYVSVGKLDYYGRPTKISPIPFVDEKNDQYENLKKTLSTLVYDVVWEPMLEEDFIDEKGNFDTKKAENAIKNSAVIFTDITSSYGNKPVPRESSIAPLIEVESMVLPFVATSLQNSTGVSAIRIDDQDKAGQVAALDSDITYAALNQRKFVPLVGNTEIQTLSESSSYRVEDFFKALESLESLREGTLGIDNTGVYQSTQYKNLAESSISNVGTALQDTLESLQGACCIVNSLWDNTMWCEISECVSKIDRNRDGMLYETQSDGDGGLADTTTENNEVNEDDA